MTLHPAPADSGIRFRRSDICSNNPIIPASWRNVRETSLCTTLENEDGVSVTTVEHLMAALAGCGIDNLEIELRGPEVPVMDGSAWPFVFLVECAGTVEQAAPRRGIRVLKPVTIGDGDRMAALEPGDGLSLSFEIDYPGTAIARQSWSVQLADGTFKSDISRARTFGFLDEVDALRAAGLARGASLDNAVVVKGRTVLNEGGLRYADEFVRHKVLDSIGDLYLAGGPILGHFHGCRSGHRMNHQLVRALLDDSSAWTPSPLYASDFVAEAPPRPDLAATA
jgi:UDP-3-O-[3-hydroxymyristoyl] N-acetylglucosamine deacetylase